MSLRGSQFGFGAVRQKERSQRIDDISSSTGVCTRIQIAKSKSTNSKSCRVIDRALDSPGADFLKILGVAISLVLIARR